MLTQLLMILTMSVAFVYSKQVNDTSQTSIVDETVSDKRKCKSMRYQYRVKPGSSWGSMNQDQQAQWMSMRCDRFFCLPNSREGKGSYDCIPLKSHGL